MGRPTDTRSLFETNFTSFTRGSKSTQTNECSILSPCYPQKNKLKVYVMDLHLRSKKKVYVMEGKFIIMTILR